MIRGLLYEIQIGDFLAIKIWSVSRGCERRLIIDGLQDFHEHEKSARPYDLLFVSRKEKIEFVLNENDLFLS